MFLKTEQLYKIIDGVRDPNSARLIMNQADDMVAFLMIQFGKCCKNYFTKVMLQHRAIFASGFDDVSLGKLVHLKFGPNGDNYDWYVGVDFTLYDST